MSFDLSIKSGDLVLSNGDLETIKGKEKLIQDILKICLTSTGANTLQPWYGSLISRTLIGSNLQTDIIFTVAKSQIQNALDNLKALQNLQVGSGQKVSPDEQLAIVKEISIVRNVSDPRLIQIKVSVLNRAFGKVQTTFNVDNTV